MNDNNVKTLFSPVVAIHGGAGTINREHMDANQEKIYLSNLLEILRTSQALLEKGDSAIEAVSMAVKMLEDSPLFNAGYGSVFTEDATHELDAAIMDGQYLLAGAVAGVRCIRNPVLAARFVMEHGQHVFMVGDGAERMARDAGLEMVNFNWFSTQERLAQLNKAQRSKLGAILDHDGVNHAVSSFFAPSSPIDEINKMGTVGAVALDSQGHLAAATSTGGMTNKRSGRVGDSALIGAGTYADDKFAAVSCTGYGEAFIRLCVAHDICARMNYAAMTLEQATHTVVHQLLPTIDGSGGLIAISCTGQVCLTFNTEGMYRGFARAGQEPQAFIF